MCRQCRQKKRAHIQRELRKDVGDSKMVYRNLWGIKAVVGRKKKKIVPSVSGFLSHSVLHYFLHIYCAISSHILTSAFLLAVRQNNDK